MTYRITGLDPTPYRPLFGLSDEELSKRGIVRMMVDEKPSYPCRVSLSDRDVGESVLLGGAEGVSTPIKSVRAFQSEKLVDVSVGKNLTNALGRLRCAILCRARIVPKSVSAEIRTRSSVRARSKIS